MSHRRAKRARRFLREKGLPVDHPAYNKLYKALKRVKARVN